jgi:hypothetical protein
VVKRWAVLSHCQSEAVCYLEQSYQLTTRTFYFHLFTFTDLSIKYRMCSFKMEAGQSKTLTFW